MAAGIKNTLADFWARIEKEGPLPMHRPELGPCWTWQGTIDKQSGYGVFPMEGKDYRIHRLAYELVKGPIPKGKELDHLCRNRACPNPNHLEPVIRKVNILRGESFAAVNARKTHCKRGHPLSGSNIIPRLSHGEFIRYCVTCGKIIAAAKRKRMRERITSSEKS